MESVTRTKHETCLIPRSHLFYISLHFTFSSIFVCSINSKITILHDSSVQSYRIPRRAKQNSEKTFRSKTKSFKRLDFSMRNSFYLFCYTWWSLLYIPFFSDVSKERWRLTVQTAACGKRFVGHLFLHSSLLWLKKQRISLVF